MSYYTTVCYFGSKINKNNIIKTVTKKEWNYFVNLYIKNKFNSFTTCSKNIGYWNGNKELTHTLTLIHQKDNNIMNEIINIAKKYSHLYEQDEILINTVKNASTVYIKFD